MPIEGPRMNGGKPSFMRIVPHKPQFTTVYAENCAIATIVANSLLGTRSPRGEEIVEMQTQRDIEQKEH